MKTPIIMLCGHAGTGKDTVAGMIAKRSGFKVLSQAGPIKELARGPFQLTQDALYGPSESRNAAPVHLNTPTAADGLRQAASYLELGYPAFDTNSQQFFALRDGLARLAPARAVTQLNPLMAAFLKGCAEKATEEKLTTRYILQQLGTEVGRAYDQLIWTRATLEAAQQAIWDGAPGVVISDGRFRSEVLTAAKYGAQTWLIRGTTTLAGATHASEVELDTLPEHFFDAVLNNDKADGLESLEEIVGQVFDYTFAPASYSTFQYFPPSDWKPEAK